MDNLELSDAVTLIFNVLRLSNKYIDETMPWSLAKDDSKKDRLETVLYNLLESIRVCSVLLSPVMPSTSKKISEQLNNFLSDLNYLEDNNYELVTPTILFQRIDREK